MSNPSKAPKKGGVGDVGGKKEEAKKISVGVNKGKSNPVLSTEDMKLRQKEHKEKLRVRCLYYLKPCDGDGDAL